MKRALLLGIFGLTVWAGSAAGSDIDSQTFRFPGYTVELGLEAIGGNCVLANAIFENESSDPPKPVSVEVAATTPSGDVRGRVSLTFRATGQYASSEVAPSAVLANGECRSYRFTVTSSLGS